jgi:hypothetical protein
MDAECAVRTVRTDADMAGPYSDVAGSYSDVVGYDLHVVVDVAGI